MSSLFGGSSAGAASTVGPVASSAEYGGMLKAMSSPKASSSLLSSMNPVSKDNLQASLLRPSMPSQPMQQMQQWKPGQSNVMQNFLARLQALSGRK